METYSQCTGRQPDFSVRYRFLSQTEGGRLTPPHQHTRWDFLYEGEDPQSDGISMIWPEMINSNGSVLPEGEVPMEGKALMFIVNAARREFHRVRISLGVRGFFVEGLHKVAECEVSEVLGLGGENES